MSPEDFSRGAARRRWAEIIRLDYEVAPLACLRCGGELRVIALSREPAVINNILRHRRAKDRDARMWPWATGHKGLERAPRRRE